MKFLVIGLGSMGKRRTRHLLYLDPGEIIGFDPRLDRCEEAARLYGIRTFNSFEHALAEEPGAFVICVPSDQHHQYAVKAGELKKHMFTESNFLREGMDDLVEIERQGEVVCAPSFTMPSEPSVNLVKKLVDEGTVGKPLCFTYHIGSWLPGWHPYEDYRKVYFSQKNTGAAKEMVAFELTWLMWMLGDVTRVTAMRGKTSDLEMDADDVYQVALEFEGGVRGMILSDVVSRSGSRNMKLACSEGEIKWDAMPPSVRVFEGDRGKWVDYNSEIKPVEIGSPNEPWGPTYVREIRNFVDAIDGKCKYPYSYAAERKITEVLAAVEKSCEEGKTITVEYAR